MEIVVGMSCKNVKEQNKHQTTKIFLPSLQHHQFICPRTNKRLTRTTIFETVCIFYIDLIRDFIRRWLTAVTVVVVIANLSNGYKKNNLSNLILVHFAAD